MPGLNPPPLIREDDPKAAFLYTQALQDLYRIARSISFLDTDGGKATGRRSLNLDAVWLRYVSNGVANTEDTVAHNLGRTPSEMWVGTPTISSIIYRGTTAWDATNVYLKASAATVTVDLILF